MGARIVGVSFGSPEVTARWVEHEKFPFEVWTDTDRQLALAFGAVDDAQQNYPRRITVVLDANGKVILEYRSASFLTNPEDVLTDLRKKGK